MSENEKRPAAVAAAERGAVCHLEGRHAHNTPPAADINPVPVCGSVRVFASRRDVVQAGAELLKGRIPILALRPGKRDLYKGETLLGGIWPSDAMQEHDEAELAATKLFRQFGDANVGVRIGAGGVAVLRIPDDVAEDFAASLDLTERRLPQTWTQRDPRGATCHWFEHPVAPDDPVDTSTLADTPVYGAQLLVNAQVFPAPPSIDPWGTHAWERPPSGCKLALLPGWLEHFARKALRQDLSREAQELLTVHTLADELARIVDGMARAHPRSLAGRYREQVGQVLEAHGFQHDGWRQDVDVLLDAAESDDGEAACEARALALNHVRARQLARIDAPEPSMVPLDLTRPADIPRREWVIEHIASPGRVTVIAGPGGSSKSTIGLALAASIATGRSILGKALSPRFRGRALYVPGEDDNEDWQAIAAAVLQHHGVDPADVAGRLHILPSGRRVLTDANGNVVESALRRLVDYVREHNIDVVCFDPLSSFHIFGEVDNGSMDRAIKTVFIRLAQEANCAVVIVHHTRKLGDREAGVDDVRGGGALVGASRATHVVTAMSDAEAGAFGVEDEERDLIRKLIVKKANFGPTGLVFWFRLAFPRIANGDSIAAAEEWVPPDPWVDEPGTQIRACQEIVNALRPDGTGYRYSERVHDPEAWVGHPIAKVLGLDISRDRPRKRVRYLIDSWIEAGLLIRVDRYVDTKKTAPFVEVGRWIIP